MGDLADLADEYRLLREGVGGALIRRDVVIAQGADTATFLQGQVSQDVKGLGDGESAWTFVLNPGGKVASLGRVRRIGAERFTIDTDPGHGDALVQRLDRFRLRVNCELSLEAWTCVAVRGPGSGGVRAATTATADIGWAGVDGFDIVAPSAEIPAGIEEVSLDAVEILRIEAGWPAMGSELRDTTIPAESGLVPETVDFTKGCYVGQELVARIHSRGGNVPRHLRGLRSSDGVGLPAGAEILSGDKTVGEVTSSVTSPALGPVALAYVHRSIDPPADAVVSGDGSFIPVEVLEVPLV